MTLEEYRGQKPPSNNKPPPQEPSIATTNQSILFIPDIYGTILHDCKETCTPIFLSPLTSETYATTFAKLRDREVKALDRTLRSIEYPTSTCAPSPYTHEGHCSPLPAVGAVHNMSVALSRLGYEIIGAGYDWRLSTKKICESEWGVYTTEVLSELSDGIIVAHGQGCRLIGRYLSDRSGEWKKQHVRGVVCVAGVSSSDAKSGLENGTWTGSMFELWGAMSERRSDRLDFASMEFELGLRHPSGSRGKPKLPDVAGPWDVVGEGVVDRYDIKEVLKSMEGMLEIAEGGVWDVGKGVCVGGCEEWGRKVSVVSGGESLADKVIRGLHVMDEG